MWDFSLFDGSLLMKGTLDSPNATSSSTKEQTDVIISPNPAKMKKQINTKGGLK